MLRNTVSNEVIAIVFNDYKEPIEKVVSNYIKRKEFYDKNTDASSSQLDGHRFTGGIYENTALPDTPVNLIKDGNGKVVKFVYGSPSLEYSEHDSLTWSEELIRDGDGKLISIVTVYPNGESVTTDLIYDSSGRMERYEVRS